MINLKMRNKFLLTAILPMVIVLGVAMSIIYIQQTETVKQDIADYRKLLTSERKKQLKDAVLIAKGAVEHTLATISDKGRALENVRKMLTPIRFADNNSGYLFIYDQQGIMILNAAAPQNHGKNLFSLKDPNGVMIIQEVIKAGRAGGGFFEYIYAKPGSPTPQPKLSYAAPIQGSEWSLGTGVYIDDIEKSTQQYSEKAWLQRNAQFSSAALSAIILALITIAIMIFIAQKIAQPINVMVATLNDIADGEGDLTKRLAIQGKDEISQLGQAFNRFSTKLHTIINEVSEATEQVTNASQSIKRQTLHVEEQLDTHNNETEQVVTAATEMSATAHEVAQNATSVADATQAAAIDSQKAQEIVNVSALSINTLAKEVEEAGKHMSSLHEQSQKIDGVLQVIGAIAEQTNLLALNAAIEAARAGEQGRGFAVVADEVRSLASRTQESTLEIKEMLDKLHQLVSQTVTSMKSSQDSSSEAVASSSKISKNLASVTNAIDVINDMSSHIATAATEQSSVTEEINRNMVAIRVIVSELLDSSHESSNISDTLSDASMKLKKLVEQFKL
ncbi:MAG: methyl-accepting chemotaxis protein [Psychromonas sp.]|jgi:methyl-accepting chemotaxis protein|uniref:methyl-accepting chemotaxis protein n=1 Tax=Psychromonas sp. TaxID=1884585 RepID=UPI0039E49F63